MFSCHYSFGYVNNKAAEFKFQIILLHTVRLCIKRDLFFRNRISGPYFRIKDEAIVHLCYSLNDRINKSLLPLTASHTFMGKLISQFSF